MSEAMHPEEIKAALRMKGYTLATLADELKRSRSMVTHVVHGHQKSKDIEVRISEILDKPRDAIWRSKAPALRRSQVSVRPNPAAPEALVFLHQHTLNRHVPAMEQGFSILTRYGELVVLDGPLADRIRDLVEQDARLNLIQLTGEGAEL